MHPEAFNFVKGVKEGYPQFFYAARVIEMGARNVNGTIRDLFDGVAYIGVDCTIGPGVDYVGLAHEFPAAAPELKDTPIAPFDTAITIEALEHDPYWMLTIRKMIELLRPGGLFIATWASQNRPEHGTTRTESSGDIYGPNPDYYKGLSWAEFNEAQDNQLTGIRFQHGRNDPKKGELDCYVMGFKKN